MKSIGDRAFNMCVNLDNIEIPSSVKTIGGGAFIGCTLTKIKFNEGLEKLGVAGSIYCMGGVFAGCTYLDNVELPDSVVEIG